MDNFFLLNHNAQRVDIDYSKTAKILNLPNRGFLKKGYFADIIIFDPNTFSDKANYTNAYKYSEGLKYAIINGKISIENGIYNESKNGKILTNKQ